MSRKIKDAKDLSTNELIYFKGHAQATYMSNGATVEDVINTLKGGSGGVASESDPVFLASPAASITANNILNWNNKQDLITDIETIRAGANKGATAVQPDSLATVATSGNYNDLTNKPTIPASVTESTVSGWGFTKNIGTVTGVKINGSTKSPSSGTVDIGNVATTVKIDNVSKTPSSGTVDLGYINKRYSGITSSSVTLTPNIYYRNTSTSLSSFSFTLGSVSNSNIINEYFIEFTTSSSGTTVSLPSGIKWMNGVTPTFEASTTYQISIVNNLGTWVKFK